LSEPLVLATSFLCNTLVAVCRQMPAPAISRNTIHTVGFTLHSLFVTAPFHVLRYTPPATQHAYFLEQPDKFDSRRFSVDKPSSADASHRELLRARSQRKRCAHFPECFSGLERLRNFSPRVSVLRHRPGWRATNRNHSRAPPPLKIPARLIPFLRSRTCMAVLSRPKSCPTPYGSESPATKNIAATALASALPKLCQKTTSCPRPISSCGFSPTHLIRSLARFRN
jgi:hypothetical protein